MKHTVDRLFSWQTLSRQWSTPRAVRRSGRKVVHANMHAVTNVFSNLGVSAVEVPMRDFAIHLTHRPGELARITNALARKGSTSNRWPRWSSATRACCG